MTSVRQTGNINETSTLFQISEKKKKKKNTNDDDEFSFYDASTHEGHLCQNGNLTLKVPITTIVVCFVFCWLL